MSIEALKTLEYLLETINNGFDEGFKTMNSQFVKDHVLQAIKEIKQIEKQDFVPFRNEGFLHNEVNHKGQL